MGEKGTGERKLKVFHGPDRHEMKFVVREINEDGKGYHHIVTKWHCPICGHEVEVEI